MGNSYAHHKFIALILRAIVRPRLHIHPNPDETVGIPARDPGRSIRVHIYKSANQHQASPVLVNFCGSGFVLRTFGSDDEYCRYIADRTNYTVIDVQYRLAPEHPFPAAFHDAEDVVKWVRSQPDQFDSSCVCLSGFSAGANIALGVSSSSEIFENEDLDVIHTVISLYGPTDMALPTPQKTQADSSNFIMRKIFPTFSHLCHKCLNPGVVDPHDPRLSPLLADPSKFPQNVLIITAAQDPFAIEAEELAKKIQRIDGKNSFYKRMVGCAHGWDKEAVRGTSQCKAKDEAYALAVDMLQRGRIDKLDHRF
ncbi:hypothetical protein N7462_008919 [Penicillium macrosclerotiorum]|uniref:uncharacterized protein n=1 Tax=Penicillium macrosclerotiorum TaxID=303699 RepID=UPI0025489419|nr:uncharacterized protein N7462_008919 [Penicillium macrosclerotiorum]KAJ5676022.1 hypothetical protein N7462_008919 [Penicillium macrosclerotiorum]